MVVFIKIDDRFESSDDEIDFMSQMSWSRAVED
jgi:hypothetical protein